jgi:LL-diaminopimelate aminotransferase
LDYGLFAAIQKAAETALQLPDTEIVAVQDRYRSRRDFMLKGLGELGWPVERWVTRATMYLWLPVPAGETSTDFALRLLEKTGVVVTPGSAFGSEGEGYMRISLICSEDRMTEALNRMQEAGIRFE